MMKPADIESFFATLEAANPRPASELEYASVFELLAAVAPEHWPALQLAWPFEERLAVVGWLVPERTHTIEDAYSRRMPLPWAGYEHA